jgi:hypothetical protein
VFSSPTATIEVVGNTGNPSSEKPDVASSGGFLINFIRRNLAKCDRKNQTKSPTAITHDSMMWPTICRRGGQKLRRAFLKTNMARLPPSRLLGKITKRTNRTSGHAAEVHTTATGLGAVNLMLDKCRYRQRIAKGPRLMLEPQAPVDQSYPEAYSLRS